MSLLLLIALQAAATGAKANDADARCLVAFGSIDPAKASAAQKAGLQIGTAYYLGRIDARATRPDIGAAIRRVRAAGPIALQPELKRCGAQVEARVAAISAASDALNDEARAAGKARGK